LTWSQAIDDLWSSGALHQALRHTATVCVGALALAITIGVSIGALLGNRPDLERGSSWLVALLQTIPAPVLVPVVTLLVGSGVGPQVAMVAFVAVWPVLLNVTVAVNAVHPRQADVMAVFGVRRGDRFLKVTLPQIVPHVFVGIRLSVPLALVVTLLVEMLTFTTGVGALLLTAQRNFAAEETYGLLVLIGLLALLVNTVLQAAERSMLRKRTATTD
jgi:ABC-type nitrate/sulfonate/bicarbonate transport system permease component